MKAAELVGDIDVKRIHFNDDEIITDILLIVRFISPDRDAPGTSYTASVGYTDNTLMLGTLDLVHDRVLHIGGEDWND